MVGPPLTDGTAGTVVFRPFAGASEEAVFNCTGGATAMFAVVGSDTFGGDGFFVAGVFAGVPAELTRAGD